MLHHVKQLEIVKYIHSNLGTILIRLQENSGDLMVKSDKYCCLNYGLGGLHI